MRVTMKQLQGFADRGMVAQSVVDDVAESQERSREKLHATEDIQVEESRFVLTAPVDVEVPIELWTANRLDAMHPIQRGRHRKRQRAVVCNAWLLAFRHRSPALPVKVTMTRFGRRTDPHDNLEYAFKHVTDEVTRLLGLRNDDTPEIQWAYHQAPRGERPMRITIRVEPQESE